MKSNGEQKQKNKETDIVNNVFFHGKFDYMLYPDTVLITFNSHKSSDYGVFSCLGDNTLLYCCVQSSAKLQFCCSAICYIIQRKERISLPEF